MISNKKHFIWTIVIASIAIAINVFIVIQSCLNGARSTSSSGLVVTLFKNIINTFSKDAINDGNINTFTNVIRKLIGHFGLFVISGLFSSLTTYFLIKDTKWYKQGIGIGISFVFGFLLAMTTEIIQLNVPGRSGEFIDVLIDTSGYILGLGIVVLILFLVLRHQKKKPANVD